MQDAVKIAVREKEEEKDLGFGSVVTNQSSTRFLNRDGSFNVERTGISPYSSINLYHWLLTMPWKKFLGVVTLAYFGINIIFGFAYMLSGTSALVDTSAEPIGNRFLQSFFFSVQTFATIGYGTIHPVGFIANFLVTIESLVGIIAQALVTGMLFARFSRPTAKIRFSDVAVIAPYKDISGFMFRLVNERANQLIEVDMTVAFARYVEENGRRYRKFDILELERKRVAFFPLSWTVVHPIDESSPLFGLSEEEVRESDPEFVLLLTAIDENFAQTVHARSSYKPEEIIWDAKFANIYNSGGDGQRLSIDIDKLSQIERL